MNVSQKSSRTYPSYEFEGLMLMRVAADVGKIRAGIAPYDVLGAIGNIALASGEYGPPHSERMPMLLRDGRRYGLARLKLLSL